MRGGGLFTWGYNDSGQLGLGDRFPREMPTQVAGVPAMEFVSCGEQHMCLISAESGHPYTCGHGAFGQLGLGATKGALEPRRIRTFSSREGGEADAPPCKQVSAGLYHTVWLSRSGDVYVCGHREYGQQGDSTDSGQYESTSIPGERSRSDGVSTTTLLNLASGTP